MSAFTCPHCNQQIDIPESYAGQVVQCTLCNGELRVPGTASEPVRPTPGSTVPPPPAGYGRSPQHAEGNGLAVASLVLGLLAFVCFGPLLSIPAVIVGHIARSRARHHPDVAGGSGMALAGLILGYLNIVIVVLAFSAAILLPAISRGGEAARRSSCQNNLKQMGIVFKMFANESRGELWPELSPEAGRLMFAREAENMGAVYPEYLTNLNVLICPSDAEAPSPGDSSNELQLIDDHSYYYLGYVITSDLEMEAFAEAYRQHLAEGKPLTDDLKVPEGMGNGGGDTIYRLREGVERFLVEPDNPAISVLRQSEIPVMWDRAGLAEYGVHYFNHVPGGGNVLFMDGHVEFIKYPGKWPMTEKTLRILEELDGLR